MPRFWIFATNFRVAKRRCNLNVLINILVLKMLHEICKNRKCILMKQVWVASQNNTCAASTLAKNLHVTMSSFSIEFALESVNQPPLNSNSQIPQCNEVHLFAFALSSTSIESFLRWTYSLCRMFTNIGSILENKGIYLNTRALFCVGHLKWRLLLAWALHEKVIALQDRSSIFWSGISHKTAEWSAALVVSMGKQFARHFVIVFANGCSSLGCNTHSKIVRTLPWWMIRITKEDRQSFASIFVPCSKTRVPSLAPTCFSGSWDRQNS